MEYKHEENQNYNSRGDILQNELEAWFLVSGDTDDFIFFGEDEHFHSEK